MKVSEVIDFFGSKKKAADALGITPSSITQWGEDVPPVRAYHVRAIMESGVGKAPDKAGELPKSPSTNSPAKEESQ